MPRSSNSKGGLTRRSVVALAPAILTLSRASSATAEAVLGDDGLYHEPWFLNSFLDLSDDLAGAADSGKRFAIMWELRGCPYCRETHLVNFADPEIVSYIRANFEVLQLDLIGLRKVVDFDRQELTEKDLAEKYAIRFTPTFQFFPGFAEGLGTKEPVAREVARAPGYLKPRHFLAMFRFVRESAYERGTFRDFLAGSAR
ncbi:MAG TPA: thioredoxin family protein [Bradyrhizobium sp.]|nr:thioredoxin family protein [Bradyrhizobium sp.]